MSLQLCVSCYHDLSVLAVVSSTFPVRGGVLVSPSSCWPPLGLPTFLCQHSRCLLWGVSTCTAEMPRIPKQNGDDF